ncbi:hypothetical protein OESDEN_10645 [Oesophagostomum dentatum]|uniref:Aldehyde dehydrogenase domain-containing protein n=1 Tax=Oesophagostomum dentatum TaxID=61180 RepID=A0A0B1SW41_OESDE|nr:hypothetical protein OESDEN_10645 [Oesophagostomum dentatum]
MTHAWVSNVPFGGVGNSGMGATGSNFGFDNIVHYKPILIRRGVGKEVANKL